MIRRFANVAGILLALAASLAFLKYAQGALAGKDLSALFDGRAMAAIVGMTVLYSLSITTTAVAWTRLLRAMRQPARFSRLLPILASTQFGKYLPGNVAHHIGRIGLARAAGVELPAAVLSVVSELLLALVVSAHLSALTLLWAPPAALLHWKVFQYRMPMIALLTMGAIAALLMAPSVAPWLARLRSSTRYAPQIQSGTLRIDATTAAVCYALYATGMVMIGCGLWLAAHALATGIAPLPGMLFFIGAFASSWILGFIAPGAPAGLGVREAVLSLWLAGVMPPSQVVVLIIALRIATTIGDLINFVWGSAVMLYQRGRR